MNVRAALPRGWNDPINPRDPTTVIAQEERWSYMPKSSLVPTGSAPGYWTSMIFDIVIFLPEWTESQTRLFANQWNRELIELEISDELATRLGLGSEGDTESPAQLG